MKKLISLLAAGSVAIGLSAAALAADAPADLPSTPAIGECGNLTDFDRITCIKERQRNLLKLKRARMEAKMTRREEKIEKKANRMENRVTRRTLENDVRATWKVSKPNMLKPYKPAGASSSSVSSAASSAATSSSASSAQ